MREVPKWELLEVCNWLAELIGEEAEDHIFGKGELHAWRRGQIERSAAEALDALRAVEQGLFHEGEHEKALAARAADDLERSALGDSRR